MKTTIRKSRMGVIGIAAVIACAMILVSASAFAAAGTKVTGLTSSENYPSVYNGNIAWDRSGEIYYWDGSSITQISSGTSFNGRASLYNGTIAYYGNDGSDNEIYYWDGTSTTQITNNEVADELAQLYNGTIAWASCVNGIDYDILYWNGSTVTSLTGDDSTNEYRPALYNGTVAWQGQGSSGFDDEIFYWNGSSTTQITDNAQTDSKPSLYNGTIAWETYSGGNYEIMYWDGTSITQISDNSTVNNRDPSLYNGTIAWAWEDDGPDWDEDICFWDGSSITQIMNNADDHEDPSLYGNMIAWENRNSPRGIYYTNVLDPASFDSIAAGIDTTFGLTYSVAELNQLLDLYLAGTGSVEIQGTTWSYMATVPEQVSHFIGDAYLSGDLMYIYLGSGIGEGGGGAPELPAGAAPIMALVFGISVGFRRRRINSS